MKIISKPFKQVNREYIITSKELKDEMGIEGEIIGIELWKGRSPNDEEAGKSPDLDEWRIRSKEITKVNTS